MRKVFTDDHHYQRNFLVAGREPKNYGLFKFLFDVVLVFITGGFWLIWIFVREMRK